MNSRERYELVATANKIGGGLAEIVNALVDLRPPPSDDDDNDLMNTSLLDEGWWTCHNTVLDTIAAIVNETPSRSPRTASTVHNTVNGNATNMHQCGNFIGGVHLRG